MNDPTHDGSGWPPGNPAAGQGAPADQDGPNSAIPAGATGQGPGWAPPAGAPFSAGTPSEGSPWGVPGPPPAAGDGPPPWGSRSPADAQYAPPPPGFAACALHPATPAVGLCTRCGSYVCHFCQRIGPDGQALCATCAERLDVLEPIPWERRREIGLWRAFYRTFKESLTQPDRFFARVARSAMGDPPLLYATMATWLGQSWVIVLYSIIGIVMAATTKEPGLGIAMALGSLVGFTILAPISALMQIYVTGGIIHLSARLFGGRGSFQASARGIAYSVGMTAIGIIPYLGAMAASVLNVVLQVYAIKHAHGFTGGRAAAAVLVPYGILFVLCCGGYVALIAAALVMR